MNLAIQEPRIRDRFPRLRCVADRSETIQDFRGGVFRTDFIRGETVTLRLQQDGLTLAEASWTTVFPDNVVSTDKRLGSFLPAKISGEDLLIKLLGHSVFTAEDSVELARSKIPEVRIAAAAVAKENQVRARASYVGMLTDQAALARAAVEDADSRVRSAAVFNLTDQVALAKVALGDQDSFLRNAAVEKLTDQATLARVVIEGAGFARNTAADRITDQALLAKLATEHRDSGIRSLAVKKLVDQAALAKVATEDQDPSVRYDAVRKLADQTVLARIADEDKVPLVRGAAVDMLAWIQKNAK